MGRWIIELSELLKVSLEEQLKESLVEAAPTNRPAIKEMFDTVVDAIRSEGHCLDIFIDDLDQFLLSSPGDEKLDWVDEHVTVYATVNHQSLQTDTILGLPFSVISIPDIIQDPKHVFIDSIMRQNYCELPEMICESIANNEYTFLQVSTLFKKVRLLNRDDFAEMRSEDCWGNTKVMELFYSLPRDYDSLLDLYMKFYTKRVGSKNKYSRLVQLLKENPGGLRVDELINMMGKNSISSAEVYNMFYYFDDFVFVEYDTESFRLRNHQALHGSYYEALTKKQMDEIIMEQASLYKIPDAMHIICTAIGEPVPLNAQTAKEMIKRYPHLFDTNSLTTFIINSYLLIMYNKERDVDNAKRYADKALSVARNMGDNMSICQGHIYWAKTVMLNDANLLTETKESGIKALELLEQNNVKYEDLPNLYMIVGHILEKEGSYKESSVYYQRALGIMKKTNYYDIATMENLANHIRKLLN